MRIRSYSLWSASSSLCTQDPSTAIESVGATYIFISDDYACMSRLLQRYSSTVICAASWNILIKLLCYIILQFTPRSPKCFLPSRTLQQYSSCISGLFFVWYISLRGLTTTIYVVRFMNLLTAFWRSQPLFISFLVSTRFWIFFNLRHFLNARSMSCKPHIITALGKLHFHLYQSFSFLSDKLGCKK